MRRAATTLVALALVTLPAAGCGNGDDDEAAPTTAPAITETVPTETETETSATDTETTAGDAETGKAIFASAGCGGCHTLSEAGSSGTVGPKLDGANLELAAVVEQVKKGGGAMPPFEDQLTEQQIADVAAFVVAASAA